MRVQERQKQLESLGISLQSSGIKVGDDKSFLVNLNADPALNELLVYYLKVCMNTQTHRVPIMLYLMPSKVLFLTLFFKPELCNCSLMSDLSSKN